MNATSFLRVVAAVGLCLLCIVWAGAASWAVPPTPTPTPMPSQGGQALTWDCREWETSQGQGGDKYLETKCAVTEWATNPPVEPPVVNVPAPVVTVLPAPVEVASSGLTDDQFSFLGIAAAIVVFLGAALLVGSWRS